MNTKKIVISLLVSMLIFLVSGISAFAYNAATDYKINEHFSSVPLQFNPNDSSSTYQLPHAKVTIYGGFVKGLQEEMDGTTSLAVRALSPLPQITVQGDKTETLSIRLENVNPDFYAKSIVKSQVSSTKITANTLKMMLPMTKGKTTVIAPAQPADVESDGKYQYIIMGDNRDGYDTFEQLLQQINGFKPVFVINNGDLVFSGKPNQYRLFDKSISTLGTTLITTLGNHDIRGNGLSTYTKLYGPAYYSFDFGQNHFIVLNSAPGWTEKQAISNQQYAWLESDLKKAQGKRLYVISHIPPHDPRSNVTKNEIPNYVNQKNEDKKWIEEKLNNYSESRLMNHGFQDPIEADRFEKIMSTYHVDTVYLSHIHSYLEYTKDGVRYLISGGAGAELLTNNSYYHYLVAKVSDSKATMLVELPSPANNMIARFTATAKLFSEAMYAENQVAVILISAGLILLGVLVVIRIYLWKKHPLDTLGKWLADIIKYAGKRFQELFQIDDRH